MNLINYLLAPNQRHHIIDCLEERKKLAKKESVVDDLS